MALTLIRRANNYNLTSSYYPHDNKYNAVFQALSDQVGSYIDFKYIFELYDYTGLIATYETAPSVNSYGTFDALMYIKNKLDDTEYENTSEEEFPLVYEYRVKVTEFYAGSTHATSTFLSSLMSLRKDNINRGQLLTKYTDITKLILTDGNGLTISQSKSTYGMAVILNYATNGTIYYKVSYSSGVIWLFKRSNTLAYSFTASSTATLTDASDSGCTFPIGYKDLLSGLASDGYYDASGVWHADTTQTGIEITGLNAVSMQVYNYTSPTQYITFNFYDCKANTIHWFNFKGGFDLFNVNLIGFTEIGNEKNNYSINNFDINLFNDNNKHNLKQIINEGKYAIVCNTNYLTADEMVYLKSLFFSDKIYIDIDNVQYPVILQNNKAIVKDTRNGLQQYELTFIYAVN